MEIKWMYNGVKVDGKLYKARYSRFIPIGKDEEQITVTAKCYWDGLPKIGNVENGSDPMTDYFEKDKIKISRNSPYWDEVVKAMEKFKIHSQKTRKIYKEAA